MALTITGCGSGGGDKKPIKAADNHGGSSTSPSASPSTGPSRAGAPTIKLPADYKVDFSGWTNTGNTTKDAVLADAKHFVLSYLAGEAYHDKNGPYKYYTNGMGAVWVSKDIQSASTYKGGVTITGTDRYYKNTIAMIGADRASVSFCEDQSKAYSKVVKTGKVLRTAPSDSDFAQFRTQLQKNSKGVWQTIEVNTQSGVAGCKE